MTTKEEARKEVGWIVCFKVEKVLRFGIMCIE